MNIRGRAVMTVKKPAGTGARAASNQSYPDPTTEQRKQVETMAQLGMSRDDIATVMDVGRTYLGKAYRAELKRGSAQSKLAILKSGYNQAVGAPAQYDDQGRMLRAEIKPNVAMTIFLMKARCGLKETDRTEHTGANGGPIKHQGRIGITISPEDEAV